MKELFIKILGGCSNAQNKQQLEYIKILQEEIMVQKLERALQETFKRKIDSYR